MKLTNRLHKIASMVAMNSVVADIGTDHAYIPVFLVKNNISQKVIASDINKGPLQRAQSHIRQNRVENFIETRLGAGLKVLKPNEVDTIIIAGMGGTLISEILEDSPKILSTTKRFILQPMIGQEVVRAWLYSNGFKIVNEVLAKEETKLYTIIVAEHGKEEAEDDIYLDIGKRLIENRDPLLKELVDKKIQKTKKIITNLKYENTDKAIERRSECEIILEKYLEIYNTVVN